MLNRMCRCAAAILLVFGVAAGVGISIGVGAAVADPSQAQAIINAAQSQLGQTYCWDGGSTTGPTHGAGNGGGEADNCGAASTVGFDCSGLALYAVYQATGIILPHSSAEQANASAYGGAFISSYSALQPGDLIFFDNHGTSTIGHVGIYLGSGQMVDGNTAWGSYPDGVHQRSVASTEGGSYGLPFAGGARYWSSSGSGGDNPPTSTEASDLALNGGFNLGGDDWSVLGSANFVTYAAGQAGTSPYEGGRFGATNTGTGGSVYQDIAYATSAGQTVCASGEFATQGSGSGAGGDLAVYLLGGSSADSSQRGFGPLPGNSRWTPASACATATGSHTTVRVQVYPNSNAGTLVMDAIDVHPDLALNGGFNLGGDDWSVLGSANFVTYAAGQAGTSPYEGGRFGATNTGTGGSVYQDIAYATSAGQTVCASGEFATQGSGSGAGGDLAVYLLGGSSADSSQRGFGPLPGNSRWTPASACATATGSHTTVRVQVYPNSNAGTLVMDAIDVHPDLALNGGFNLGGDDWSVLGSANFVTYAAGQAGTSPYEGGRFGATNTGTGGSVYQDIAYATSAGQTVCASGEFATQGSGSGAGGDLAVYLLGGSSADSSQRGFGPLPGNSRWTPASACATATGSHTTVRVQVYPNSNAGTLVMDAIDTQSAGFGVGYQRPSIVTRALPRGALGRSYSITLRGARGARPYRWSVASGVLPHGLKLSTSGHLVGKPSRPGLSKIKIRLRDSSSPAISTTRRLKINVAPIAVRSAAVFRGRRGRYFRTRLATWGGIRPEKWVLYSGRLPHGLHFSRSGLIYGHPTQLGRWIFVVKVTDARAQRATRTIQLRIAR